MAEITNAITYEQAHADLIEQKLGDPSFTHNLWSAEDLQELRSAIREFYRNEQNGRCAYCQNPISLHNALNCNVEHIAPKSKYPAFIFEPKNLCVICADCNTIKRDQQTMNQEPDTIVNGAARVQYPRSSAAFYIVHPHFDRWDDHIQVFGKYYVDKTAKGHFTIGACVLNRHLREFGWEPAVIDDEEIREAMTTYMNSVDPVAKTSSLLRLMRLLNQI